MRLTRAAAAALSALAVLLTPTNAHAAAPGQLQPGQEPAAALFRAAKETGLDPHAKTAGPSNIGNLLASHGNIAATAGFGVLYEGLHGLDERAHLAELSQVYAVYHQAVVDLLRPV